MWGLVNPEIKETISKDTLKVFLNKLGDVAVDVALHYSASIKSQTEE